MELGGFEPPTSWVRWGCIWAFESWYLALQRQIRRGRPHGLVGWIASDYRRQPWIRHQDEAGAQWIGLTRRVSSVRLLPKGADLSPMLKGLPDDLCQCPHWGLRSTFQSGDSRARERRDIDALAVGTHCAHVRSGRHRRPNPSQDALRHGA